MISEDFIESCQINNALEKDKPPRAGPWNYEIIWLLVFAMTYLHLAAVYGLYLLFAKAAWATIAFNCLTFYLSAVGACAGSHRLWSHRSYKATWPLQIFLMLCHCLSLEFSIFQWVRNHRLHHKFSDTDADPYNASRGFFFSHVGWTCVKKHPEVIKRMMLVDMSDILANPIVMFQKKYSNLVNFIFAFVIPISIPIFLWNETFSTSFHVNAFRVMLSANGVFCINSLAHMFGTRPYDESIYPSQNIITTLLTFGEGFHNYHHTFPIDYKAGEFGSFFNFSTSFINFCANLGLAYDLKEVSKNTLEQRILRTGDGSDDIYGIKFMVR